VDIQGKPMQEAALIPRSALHQDNTVWIVDENDRIQFRKVSVARIQGEKVLVQSGLKRGELLVTSSLKAVTNGMVVQVADIEGKLVKAKGAKPAHRTPEQIIAEMKERLRLTEEQLQLVRPIMLEHIKEQGAIRKKYGGKGFSGIQSLRRNMQKLSKKTNGRLDGILTADQMSEYAEFQREMRERARAAMGGPPS
jgi:hypothetical protein